MNQAVLEGRGLNPIIFGQKAGSLRNTSSQSGAIGKRNKHQFSCPRCGFQCHSDWNASINIGTWVGRTCSLELQQNSVVMAESVLESGVDGSPPILVNTHLRSGDGE